MAQKRKANLYFGTHNDCFVHGKTREWTSWLKPSLDQLHLVRLVFPNGFCLLASFSTRPALPSSIKKRAPLLSSDEYLEIDLEYAKCLKIKEGELVIVECIPDLPMCKRIEAIPRDEIDYEILEANREKIEFEMLNQVRVVSAKFPFPIWINQQPICLKLKSSDPPAAWVLISDNTYIGLCITRTDSAHTGSAIDTPTSPFAFRTSTEESNQSNQSYFSSVSTQQPTGTFSNNNTRKNSSSSSLNNLPKNSDRNPEIPVIKTHRPSRSDVSLTNSQGFLCYGQEFYEYSPSTEETEYFEAENEEEEEFEMDNPFTKLFSSIGSFFNRNKSPDSDNMSAMPENSSQRSSYLLSPTEESRPSFSHRSLSPSKSFTYGSGGHVKQNSWSGRSDFERARTHPPYPPIYLFPFRVALRLQTLPPEVESSVWGLSNVFDIFVHPNSLPHHHHISRIINMSFLVRLTLVDNAPLISTVPDSSVSSSGRGTPSVLDPSVNNGRGTPSVGSSNGGSSESSSGYYTNSLNSKNIFNRLSSMIGDNSDRATPSPTPPQATPTLLDHRPHPPHYSKVVVAHMHVVTGVTERRRRSVSSNVIEEVSVSREGSSSPSHSTSVGSASKEIRRARIPVRPGHVLMSELLARQLGVKRNCRLLLTEVKEEWRIDCRQNKVHVELDPIEPRGVQLNSSDYIKGFKDLVTVNKNNVYGLCFVNHMILPVPIKCRTNNEAASLSLNDTVFCRVSTKIEKPILPLKEFPLKIYQIFPHDVKTDHYNNKFDSSSSRRVEIKVVSAMGKGREGGGTTMPAPLPLKQFDGEELKIEQFGAINELFSTCCSHLYTSFAALSHSYLLLCGSGGVASGCGKTSLASLLAKALSRSMWQFHVIKVNCMLLRGKNLRSIKKYLGGLMDEVVSRSPAVIVLDDLDESAKHINDVQKEVTGEALVNTKNAQTILEFLIKLRSHSAIVIATSSNKQSLHPVLLQYKGRHLFHVIEIEPPNMGQRLEILEALLHNSPMQSVISQEHMRTLALRTEGFQVKDLSVLVERAVGNAEKQNILNNITRNTGGRISSSLGPVWLSQTPPAKKDSVVTVVPRIVNRGVSVRPSIVTEEDFEIALKNYLPSALKGLSLHSRGRVNFRKVGGLEEAKQTLTEVMLWPSKYPKVFECCPIKQHSGVLLYGAPGTGKTLLAEAVANEFCLNFVSIKGPELLNKYIGASEQAVRDLFSRARAAKPCILFFDEFDSLAPQRGHDRTGVTDRVVNQLLTELDGAESSEGVYILAASSRPDLIDPALLRPGRINKILYCNIPADEDERHAILKALTVDLTIEESANLHTIAQATIGFTGADLKALLYNAQLLAVHKTLADRTNIKKTTIINESTGEEEKGGSTLSTTDPQRTGSHSDEELKVWQFQNETMSSPRLPQSIERLVSNKEQSTSDKEDKLTHLRDVTQEDLEKALQDTPLSLSKQERGRYERIYQKFRRGQPVEKPNQRVTLA